MLATENQLEGPVNICSPEPTTNQKFTISLGRALERPTCLNVPAFILRGVYGEFAEEMLVSGQSVAPKKLLGAGFAFKDHDLDFALQQELSTT
jgi:NAD dependent epimerase/dehydratase family enzyme